MAAGTRKLGDDEVVVLAGGAMLIIEATTLVTDRPVRLFATWSRLNQGNANFPVDDPWINALTCLGEGICQPLGARSLLPSDAAARVQTPDIVLTEDEARRAHFACIAVLGQPQVRLPETRSRLRSDQVRDLCEGVHVALELGHRSFSGAKLQAFLLAALAEVGP